MRPVIALAACALVALAACKEEEIARPDPVAMTDETVGYYCQMYVMDHPGPKGQIFVKGFDAPFWFSQVTDARAFVLDPEREGEVLAIYVSDMGAAESWAIPGENNWIPVETAYYVIESTQLGGMGTPEAISYASRVDAEALVAEVGGRVVGWEDLTDTYVRPDFDQTGSDEHAQADEHAHDAGANPGQIAEANQ